MFIHIVVLSLIFSFVFDTNATSEDEIIGFWQVDFAQTDKSKDPKIILETKRTLFIRRKGESFEIIDCNYGKRYEGKLNDKKELVFEIPNTRWGSVFVTLKVIPSEKKLIGTYFQKSGPRTDTEYELSVERLASVWACSNHTDPTHTAKSTEEMKELTATRSCEGWKKLETSGM